VDVLCLYLFFGIVVLHYNTTSSTLDYTLWSLSSSSSSSSSAYHSPLLDVGLSNASPSRSIFGYSHPQLLSAVLRISSLHLARGRPTLRLPRRGLHSRTRLPQQLSVLRLIWPAHCHFSMLIRCAMSVTLVLCRLLDFISLLLQEL
jgi:hypothetical protein